MASYLYSFVDFIVIFATSIFGIFVSLQFFDRLTQTIEEWKELKKGNTAIALLFASLVLSLSLFVGALAEYAPFAATSYDPNALIAMLGKIFFVLYLLAGTLASIVILFVSVSIVDQLTVEIDELAELKNGNIAIAIFVGSILIGISYVLAPFLPPLVAGLVGIVSKLAGIVA